MPPPPGPSHRPARRSRRRDRDGLAPAARTDRRRGAVPARAAAGVWPAVAGAARWPPAARAWARGSAPRARTPSPAPAAARTDPEVGHLPVSRLVVLRLSVGPRE